MSLGTYVNSKTLGPSSDPSVAPRMKCSLIKGSNFSIYVYTTNPDGDVLHVYTKGKFVPQN